MPRQAGGSILQVQQSESCPPQDSTFCLCIIIFLKRPRFTVIKECGMAWCKVFPMEQIMSQMLSQLGKEQTAEDAGLPAPDMPDISKLINQVTKSMLSNGFTQILALAGGAVCDPVHADCWGECASRSMLFQRFGKHSGSHSGRCRRLIADFWGAFASKSMCFL